MFWILFLFVQIFIRFEKKNCWRHFLLYRLFSVVKISPLFLLVWFRGIYLCTDDFLSFKYLFFEDFCFINSYLRTDYVSVIKLSLLFVEFVIYRYYFHTVWSVTLSRRSFMRLWDCEKRRERLCDMIVGDNGKKF